MANIITNAIMNPSTLASIDAKNVAAMQQAKTAGANLDPANRSQIVRSSLAESERGWLPMGVGENVDIMA